MFPSKFQTILSAYRKLPLVGQIAIPIVLILAIKFLWGAATTLISFGIMAVIVYFIFEFVRKNMNK